VLFKANANNAITYQLLVEGKTLIMPNGQLSYTFTTVGTNTFTVIVSAHNSDKSISASTSFSITVKEPQTAADITKAMGPGFNLGNTFDLGINPTSINSIKSIIDIYAAVGMKHIRIPVSWLQSVNGSTLANTTTGKVDFTHPRFLELKETIDYALSKGLFVVINSHHEHWLKNYYDGSATYNTKFSTLWTDIATYFKSYSDKLIFDVLNEPEGTMGQWGTVAGFTFPQPTTTTAINLTRQII
jgi:aryl-phospho-beta-D-glucosidase BglC (GH1 family)